METPPATRRAGIYARISQDRDGTMLGVDRQREDCERLAASLSWEVAGLYIDNDVSAYSGRPRPQYARLMADVAAGRVDAILAWHPDRLHRSPRELEDFVALVERTSTAVETATAGGVDLATPSGRMVARMLGAAARYESEHKAERARRKARQRAEQGKPNKGGSRPFGLSADWAELVPAEATALQDAARRVLDGTPIHAIARELDAAGLLPSGGGRWTVTSLRRILTSWRAAGWREHEGVRVAQGDWPAILDVETVERLRLRLNDPDRHKFYRRSGKYLLSGFLLCGQCGRRLFTRPTNDGERRYACVPHPDGCGGVSVRAERLEEYVSELVFEALDSPALSDAIANEGDREPGSAVQRLHEAEASLTELAQDFYTHRLITRAEFLATRGTLEDRVEAARREVAARDSAGQVLPFTGSARAAWPGLDMEQRREVVAAAVESVTVNKARRGFNKFDPGRVPLDKIAWRA